MAEPCQGGVMPMSRAIVLAPELDKEADDQLIDVKQRWRLMPH
jgi:hypothetical protein